MSEAPLCLRPPRAESGGSAHLARSLKLCRSMGSEQGEAKALDRSMSLPAVFDEPPSRRPADRFGVRRAGRALAERLVRATLVRLWASDRALGVATALLSLVALSPMFVTPFLPLADLPDHTAQGHFDLQKHGRFYDDVLVQGLAYDPIPRLAPLPDVRPRLVVEAGRFRLYAIDKS